MLMVPTRWFSADLWAKLRVSHVQQQHLLTLSTVLDLKAPLELQNLTLYSPFFLSLQQSVNLNMDPERNSAPADLSSSCSQWFVSCSSSFTGNSTEPRTYICREEQVRRGRGWTGGLPPNPVAGLTVPSERSFTSYTVSFTCVCWLMQESWKKATLLR